MIPTDPLPTPVPDFEFNLPLPTLPDPVPVPTPAAARPPAPIAAPHKPDPVWESTPPTDYLPDGKPLLLTLSRKLLLSSFFPHMEGVPQSPFECAFTLYLAAHPRSVWEAPVTDPEDELLKPLWMVPELFKAAVDDWLDAALPQGMEPAHLQALVARLWTHQHSTQVVSAADAAAAEKKNPLPSVDPLLSSTSPPSSAPETPSATSSSSMSSPSTPPTLSSTPN